MKAGITGHQNIGSPDDIVWVKQMLAERIVDEHITSGFTSLAVGADQLFASLLREHSIHYTAVIPCTDYEKTFSSSNALRSFENLRSEAFDVIVLPYQKPEEAAFWEAGKKIVELSEIILAVWNGLPAKGLGGTADVVRFALENNTRVIHIDPVKRRVVDAVDSATNS